MKPIAAVPAAVLLLSVTSPAAAAERVSVYPSPGVVSASPKTQISFRNLDPAALGKVVVRGSRSGRHTGRVRRHSDGRGVSWLPRRRFRKGERVTVRTGLHLVGARNGDWGFRIGRIPKRVTIQHRILEDIPPGRLQRFKSRPDLKPPAVVVDGEPGQTAPGHVFLTPKSKRDVTQAGPMIADNGGGLIYFRPMGGITAATDFRAQTYRGKPVLTYWRGTSRQGIGVGEIVVMDQTYRTIRRIRTPNGFRPDLHEFVITPQDTGILITYPSVRTNLRPVGGPRNGLAVDSVIQEIDLATGLVVFEWHSLGRIRLRESYSKPENSPNVPFDYVHSNSVNLDRDGDFLMSARNTWGVYKIDRESGRIRWRLGGKRSTFELGRGVRFAWQHDAQRRADGAITLFDNSAFPPVRKRSRAIAVRLNRKQRTARLISARIHPRELLAATQGNHQNLPNGGAFVGWGSQRWFTEYDAAGEVVWNARVSLGFETYRAYRLPWVGTPHTRPRAAGRDGDENATTVYASWNGATEVAGWEFLAGPSKDALTPVAVARRSGFETEAVVPGDHRWVAARARDASGAELSTSPPARVR